MLRCVYVDLDGTLLGAHGSLLHDGSGDFSLLGARALEACHRRGVEVVLFSGRARRSVEYATRLLGLTDFIYEAGCGLVVAGEEDPDLLRDWAPRNGRSTFDLIEESGAPRLLLHRFRGRLEYHTPWSANREISHLFRGRVDAFEADAVLRRAGFGSLRLVDNGAIHPASAMPSVEDPRAYHLVPAHVSKGFAVARHQQVRGLDPAECIAVGDSREDLGAAPQVATFWLVANAVDKDPGIRGALAGHPNVRVAEAGHGAGVYEAVISTLAEER